MAAYYTALAFSFAGALWLIPGARLHVYALSLWLGVSVGFDLAGAYELKLFVDFFGFVGLAWLTIRDAIKGQPIVGKNVCALLGLAQVGVSAIAYGVSYGFKGFHLPYESFSVLMNTHGVSLNALFIASVWALFIGVAVRGRVFDTIHRLGRIRLRHSDVPAPQKAYVQTTYSGLDFS